MKSLKSILKLTAVAVSMVTMSGSLTSCGVLVDCLDAAFAPDYVVTREVHYHDYHDYHDYHRSYYDSPRHSDHKTVIYHRY